MAEKRGSIAFFATYRPPVPLDIFSCSKTSKQDELHMTDGVSYNYNAQVIPSAALKTILKRPKLASEGSEADVNSGRLTGLIFVSERGNLETLHIALRFNDSPPKVKVFSFADVFGTFDGVRMEDSGSIAGDYLVYVTTKDDPSERRQPWTAVYRTNLKTGRTDRLTPKETADLSPAVSPSGKRIAVATFQRKGGWDGEIEDLKTDIYVMNVEKPPLGRKKLVENGGWPTWGSDNVIFFHRKVGEFWGVFRFDISNGSTTRVTPDGIDAITPAAINANEVAVATIRQKSQFSDVRVEAQYRHIEIFDSTGNQQPLQITQKTRPKADHFNPFVLDGGKRIGYHRSRSDLLKSGDDIPRKFFKLDSPHQDVGLFRVSGVFPTFSKDGSKLAFVDNEFKAVWVADSKGLRVVYETKGPDNIFSPVWNQDPEKDILYVCMGPSFNAGKRLDICAIPNVSSRAQHRRQLTKAFNNAFPSTNPDGTKLVFRSTRDGGDKRYKNLYIMEDAQSGDFGEGNVTRLTNGPWTDTQCQWSPRGDWIVFSSTRDKPNGAPETDNNLDPGYFAVFLVKADDPSVVVRVVGSANDLSGHVNHPFFSPDGKSIVVTADLAAVSVDPISLPLFLHSVRPYGDIFTVDIDPDDINKNKNVKKFNRITHSRYEYSTASWTMYSTQDPNAAWNLLLDKDYTPSCPYAYPDGGESWHMTGHLIIPRRCC
ncbi:Tricorn protease [Parasponia andersonii]|uniref:Tricorn protease n=1 Tax=Parasponia andersonii TaxID=3476 RepID=A0A2P5D015_PARAD|nr:Tricorn protease [Parasponia andersonii]